MLGSVPGPGHSTEFVVTGSAGGAAPTVTATPALSASGETTVIPSQRLTGRPRRLAASGPGGVSLNGCQVRPGPGLGVGPPDPSENLWLMNKLAGVSRDPYPWHPSQRRQALSLDSLSTAPAFPPGIYIIIPILPSQSTLPLLQYYCLKDSQPLTSPSLHQHYCLNPHNSETQTARSQPRPPSRRRPLLLPRRAAATCTASARSALSCPPPR